MKITRKPSKNLSSLCFYSFVNCAENVYTAFAHQSFNEGSS